MLQEHNTRTSLRAQRRLSLWQQRKKRHSWKSKHLKKINLQYARHWYIVAGWRREWSRGDKREKRRRKRWPFESSMACVVQHASADTQEVIEREKIRRKGGKDITDLKQKWEKCLSMIMRVKGLICCWKHRMELQEAKKIAEERRREKQEDRLAKWVVFYGYNRIKTVFAAGNVFVNR